MQYLTFKVLTTFYIHVIMLPTEQESGMNWYALYRGDELLTVGSIRELSEYLQVKELTVRFYGTPGWLRRINQENAIYIIKIEEDEDDW